MARKCQFEGCKEIATHIACGREFHHGGGHPKPKRYCEKHASVVADEGNPEYTVGCPKCGCNFGVN